MFGSDVEKQSGPRLFYEYGSQVLTVSQPKAKAIFPTSSYLLRFNIFRLLTKSHDSIVRCESSIGCEESRILFEQETVLQWQSSGSRFWTDFHPQVPYPHLESVRDCSGVFLASQ
eukprot:scaffold23539_cov137-Cylindrotheca_fusiformis.AAC.9